MSSENNIFCYICLKKIVSYSTSICGLIATYSKTPMKTYLEHLSEQYPLTATDDELDSIFLCDECQLKLNNYDFACLTSKNIEKDLRNLLKKSKQLSHETDVIIKPEIIIKEENDYDVIKNENEHHQYFSDNDNGMFSSDEEISLNEFKKNTKTHSNVIGCKKKLKPAKKYKKSAKSKGKKSRHSSNIAGELKHCSICGHQTKTIDAMKVYT